MQAIPGFFLLIALAWLLSENKRALASRQWINLILGGTALQFLIALLLVKQPWAQDLFMLLNQAVLALEQATRAGTRFVFGYLGGGDLPFDEPHPGAAYVLAFRALPMILVMSALSALLFHWRVLPLIVSGFALLLEKSMHIGGALGLGAATNVFMGMVESPLVIRPYLV